jgi:phosphoribosylformimino-5-aminoimidazole carboxamide ribotide isomerase
MQVIGVIDLLHGIVVRGVAGLRQQYRPIESRLCPSSHPADIARVLAQQLGLNHLYIADLDAIAGAEPAWSAYEAMQESGARLWIDAGIRRTVDGNRLAPAGTVVAGLETIEGPEVLEKLAAVLGEKLVFSLDLREGAPVGSTGWRGADAWSIAAEAVARGVSRLIVLDLARVGVGLGTGTETFCAQLASTYPDVEIYAGGGVRGKEDLMRLRACGLTGVLVASALHDGRITREDLREVQSDRHS